MRARLLSQVHCPQGPTANQPLKCTGSQFLSDQRFRFHQILPLFTAHKYTKTRYLSSPWSYLIQIGGFWQSFSLEAMTKVPIRHMIFWCFCENDLTLPARAMSGHFRKNTRISINSW